MHKKDNKKKKNRYQVIINNIIMEKQGMFAEVEELECILFFFF